MCDVAISFVDLRNEISLTGNENERHMCYNIICGVRLDKDIVLV